MPRCPSCHAPMTRVEQDGLHWCACGSCFGTWISNLALLRRLRDAAQPSAGPAPDTAAGSGQEATLADLAQTVSVSNTREILHCPACEKPMAKDRIHPMIPVEIDRCKICGYTWLDAGEMELMRRLYRELMTSDDPEIVRRRDKIASVMSEWESRKGRTIDTPPLDREADAIVQGGMDILGFLLTGRW